MARKRIDQLDADPGNANVARGDLAAIVRGNDTTTYKANLNDALLPPSSSADVGKVLQVASGGKPAWVNLSEETSTATIYTAPSGGLGINTLATLSGSNRFNSYALFQVGLGFGSDAGTSWAWTSPLSAVAGTTRFIVSNLNGTGFVELVITGNNRFTILSGDNSVRVHRIAGVDV